MDNFYPTLQKSKLCSFYSHVESTPSFSFHLREASTVRNRFEDELWLFGRESQGRSVAIRVMDFYPSFLIDIHDWEMKEVDEAIDVVSKAKPREWLPSTLIRTHEIPMVRLIGFSYNRPRTMLEITYRNPALLRFIRTNLGTSRKPPRLYHDDWEWENQFLHKNGIQLQTWVDVDMSILRTSQTRKTSCTLEYQLKWKKDRIRTSPVKRPHMVLMASVRMRALSAQGRLEKKPLVPTFKSGRDSVVMVASTLYWLGRPCTPQTFLFVLGKETQTTQVDTSTYRLEYPTEAKLVEGWFTCMTQADVDTFVYLSDVFPTLLYLCQRLSVPNLSKFKNQKCKFFERAGLFYYRTPGRTRADLKPVLQKTWVDPGLKGYTLKAALEHPQLYRKHVPPEFYDIQSLQTSLDWPQAADRIEQELLLENKFLVDWEMSRSTVLEHVAVSAQCFCELTACMIAGQQTRVWHKLLSECHRERLYINKEQLFEPARYLPRVAGVVFHKFLERTPLPDVMIDVVLQLANVNYNSYQEPPDLPNIRMRDRGKKRKRTKAFRRTVTGQLVEVQTKEQKRQEKAKKKTRFAGGLVYEPIAGYYTREDERTGTLDFASLYPSIIIGYEICYMALVFDKEVLDDPTVEKRYVPIAKNESLVLVKGQRTLLPNMINQLLQQRRSVKRQMQQAEKGSFEQKVLNCMQLSCKVTQNATYGFLGVRRNGKLTCPPLASSVCCIGQWMNRKTKFHVLKTGGCVVYGDTDSVMVQYPKPHVPDGPEPYEIRLNRAYYALFEQVAAEASKLFPPPNKLEFEGMKFPFALYKKKNYAAQMWSEFDPTKPDKVHVSGLTCKKRDKCPWVRHVGLTIVDMLMHRKDPKEMVTFLKTELTRLVRHEVPIGDLTITCEMKALEEYSNDNLIQVTVANKILERTGRVIPPKSRVSYVVVAGPGKHYTRGEHPDYVEKHRLPLDYVWYIQTQLMTSIQTLLEFSSIDLSTLVKPFLGKMHREGRRLPTIGSMMRRMNKNK